MADPGRPVAGTRGAPGPVMSRGRSAAALVAVFGFFFLISNAPINPYDEGFVLYAAERILRGDLPYRDFQLHYLPAQFYVLAALFKTFGHSIFVERMWDAAVRTGVVAAGFGLARILMPAGPAAVAALLIMLRLGASGFHGINLFPALLFALLSAGCFLSSFPGSRRGWLIAAGLLVGVAVLFRQDFGAYAVAIELLMLGAWRQLGRPAGLVPYAVALGAVTLPAALFFLWRVGPASLWHELVVYPRSVVIAQLTIPFPALLPDFGVLVSMPGWRMGRVGVAWGQWTDFYVPLLAYAWTITLLARSFWLEGRAAAGRRETWALVFLAAIGLALFGYAFYRFDPIHAVATFVPTAVLVTRGLWTALAPRRVGLRAVAAGLTVLGLTFLWVGVPFSRWAVGSLKFRPPICATPLARTGCIDLEEYQRGALEFVDRFTAPGEPIFVGVSRHHPIPQDDVSFYFLSGHPPATRFAELLGRAATPVAIQEEMIERLKRPEVRHIVLYAGNEDPERPEGGEGSGAALFDAYVRSAFRVIARSGPYSILEKR
jgi:4-amino-4-deoxy-L-arabinose transferase-like glycosyltransferase